MVSLRILLAFGLSFETANTADEKGITNDTAEREIKRWGDKTDSPASFTMQVLSPENRPGFLRETGVETCKRNLMLCNVKQEKQMRVQG